MTYRNALRVLRCALSVASAAALTCLAAQARADVDLALSIERVAGVAYTSARPSNSDSSLGLTSFNLGGPAINPVALPRIGADAILPMGLTLGGAIAYGHATLSNNPDQGTSSSTSAYAWLISPRIGYVFHLSPLFDLTPRAGITLAKASFTNADSQSCNFTGGATTCTTVTGDSTSLTMVAASIEVVGALRLTRTFNLLGGLSYDHVVSASGSNDASNGTSRSTPADGKYLGVQLWFGLGGYVL